MIGKIGITKCAHISRRKFDIIFDCFVTDIPATKTGQIAHVNRNTANRYYGLFRKIVIENALKERREARLSNGVEIDESYFGPSRIRGKRGRGAGNKILVLGLLKREGKVFTEVVNRATKKELLPIIQKVVQSGSDIYTDGWGSYDALAVYGYNHKKVKHTEDEFARPDGTHVNGVESYWSWVKRRLSKFNGIRNTHFNRNLLESEWRFNHRDDLRKTLRKLLRFS